MAGILRRAQKLRSYRERTRTRVRFEGLPDELPEELPVNDDSDFVHIDAIDEWQILDVDDHVLYTDYYPGNLYARREAKTVKKAKKKFFGYWK